MGVDKISMKTWHCKEFSFSCTYCVLCFAGNQTVIIGQPVPSAASEALCKCLFYRDAYLHTALGFKNI